MAKRGRGARAPGPRADSERFVGVLAIQGDVEKHLAAIARCGARGRRVRVPADLAGLSALILPLHDPVHIADIRKSIADREQPWTHDELVAWQKERAKNLRLIPK